MALTPEDITTIKADLGSGFTPLVITGPDQSVLGTLTKAFPEKPIIDVSQYSSVGAFGDELIHIVMRAKDERNLVIVHNTHRSNPDLTKSLRALARTKKIGGIQLSKSLQFIYLARDTSSGIALNPFGHDLTERHGLVIRLTRFVPKRGIHEITKGVNELRAHLRAAIETAQKAGDTEEADRLTGMDQCLVLAARGKHDYLPEKG